jgi:hypothetical protein
MATDWLRDIIARRTKLPVYKVYLRHGRWWAILSGMTSGAKGIELSHYDVSDLLRNTYP